MLVSATHLVAGWLPVGSQTRSTRSPQSSGVRRPWDAKTHLYRAPLFAHCSAESQQVTFTCALAVLTLRLMSLSTSYRWRSSLVWTMMPCPGLPCYHVMPSMVLPVPSSMRMLSNVVSLSCRLGSMWRTLSYRV